MRTIRWTLDMAEGGRRVTVSGDWPELDKESKWGEAVMERYAEAEYVPASQLTEAVNALRAIYDRHHMAGDGSAGKVSGDALRALGIDPDTGSEP